MASVYLSLSKEEEEEEEDGGVHASGCPSMTVMSPRADFFTMVCVGGGGNCIIIIVNY